MKNRRRLFDLARLLLLSSLLLSTSAALLAQDKPAEKPTDKPTDKPPGINAPAGTLVEAEGNPISATIVEDTLASGGKGLTSANAWQPIFSAMPPADAQEFTVWARHKSGPIQIKLKSGGKTTEKKWIYETPETFRWSNMGRYKRSEMDEGIIIIRSSKRPQPDPVLDCVVFSPDATALPVGQTAPLAKVLPSTEPDASAAPITMTASVNWSQRISKITREVWGVNDYEILNPQNAADPEFQSFLASMSPALIRIHNGALSERWTDEKTRAWDIEKIKAGFAASTGYGKAKIIFNIPTWPRWMAPQNAPLPVEKHAELATLIGKLVIAMRDEVKQPIAYWEILNETEITYEKAGRLDEMWTLLNTLAAEIHRVDPSAKVGGPALSWPKPEQVKGYLDHCGKNMDIFTWHNYASGDIYESNESIFRKAEVISNMAKYAFDVTKQKYPDKHLQCFLTETNIKWTWDPIERRHANNIGAIFQATVVKRMATLGMDGALVWHAKGNAYGLIDANNKLRATGQLYLWGNQFLVGDLAQSDTADASKFELLPVIHTDGSRALLLLNKAPASVTIAADPVLGAGVSAESLKASRIDATGTSDVTLTPDAAGALTLPGYSATLVRLP